MKTYVKLTNTNHYHQVILEFWTYSIEWTVCSGTWNPRPSCMIEDYADDYMYCGLDLVHKIISTHTYELRLKHLESDGSNSDHSISGSKIHWLIVGGVMQNKTPIFEQGDNGPEVLLNMSQSWHAPFNRTGRRSMLLSTAFTAWGASMWDSKRIRDVVPDEALQLPQSRAFRKALFGYTRTKTKKPEVSEGRSWAIRRKLYDQGVRGKWDGRDPDSEESKGSKERPKKTVGQRVRRRRQYRVQNGNASGCLDTVDAMHN